MREQQSPNVGSVIGDSLSFCHLCCIGKGFPWSYGQLPGGSGPCRPLRHRQESHLLFSAGMGLLPTSPCSTARDNRSDLDLRLNQFGSSTATKPLCSSQLSYLPQVYPSQRFTTLLCLWSWTSLLCLAMPLEPRLFVISLPLNIFPLSPGRCQPWRG